MPGVIDTMVAAPMRRSCRRVQAAETLPGFGRDEVQHVRVVGILCLLNLGLALTSPSLVHSCNLLALGI